MRRLSLGLVVLMCTMAATAFATPPQVRRSTPHPVRSVHACDELCTADLPRPMVTGHSAVSHASGTFCRACPVPIGTRILHARWLARRQLTDQSGVRRREHWAASCSRRCRTATSAKWLRVRVSRTSQTIFRLIRRWTTVSWISLRTRVMTLLKTLLKTPPRRRLAPAHTTRRRRRQRTIRWWLKSLLRRARLGRRTPRRRPTPPTCPARPSPRRPTSPPGHRRARRRRPSCRRRSRRRRRGSRRACRPRAR